MKAEIVSKTGEWGMVLSIQLEIIFLLTFWFVCFLEWKKWYLEAKILVVDVCIAIEHYCSQAPWEDRAACMHINVYFRIYLYM